MLNENAELAVLKRTLLYEGYALFPYHRSATKNQKPIPFGVVFPDRLTRYDQYAHSRMQAECILKGTIDQSVNIEVCFLHLKEVALFQYKPGKIETEEVREPVPSLFINGKFYQAGWQTIERKINSGALSLLALIKTPKTIPFVFPGESREIYIENEKGDQAAIQTTSLSEITGTVAINATAIQGQPEMFKLSVNISNTTTVVPAGNVTRNEVQDISFLSTHIIFYSETGVFISHQDPGETWKNLIAGCVQENAWPVLVGEKDNILLASPIILYDHPVINPQSNGDLFDSTEIEEALLLHVSVLSDNEKDRITQTDDKLKAMLNKVSQLTPEELLGFHSGLRPINETKA